MKKKSMVYVDGFNLFFGMLKGTKGRKWLDLQVFFEKLRTDDDIVCIKYFTTGVLGNKKKRQDAYIKALSTRSKIKIIYGKFKTHNIRCLVDCGYTGEKSFLTPIEKRTDVNIASHLISDAILCKNIRKFIIVSGDSDLIPAIEMVKSFSQDKQIIVYVPHDPKQTKNVGKVSTDIRNAADKHKNLPVDLLAKLQFPQKVIDSHGNTIFKPPSW